MDASAALPKTEKATLAENSRYHVRTQGLRDGFTRQQRSNGLLKQFSQYEQLEIAARRDTRLLWTRQPTHSSFRNSKSKRNGVNTTSLSSAIQ